MRAWRGVPWFKVDVSDDNVQGSVGRRDNGCAAKGTCGLPFSGYGLGGGWELCFA